MELLNDMWNELIKKIELQSILVLFITLLFGSILLRMDNSLNSPAGILGSASIAIGIIYTICSFFSNQIRESYKDVISEYKATISTLRSSNKDVTEYYKKTISETKTTKQIGEYQAIESDSSGTQKDF